MGQQIPSDCLGKADTIDNTDSRESVLSMLIPSAQSSIVCLNVPGTSLTAPLLPRHRA
jgi:hypothetical protein